MQRTSCLAFGFALAVCSLSGAASAAPSAAPSQLACLPPDGATALAECKASGAHDGKRSGVPALALPASGRLRVPAAAPQKKQAPGLELDATQRTAQTRIEQRKLSLLQREIALVERLRKNGRTQPALLIRLGQLYFELGQTHERAARELDQPLFDA